MIRQKFRLQNDDAGAGGGGNAAAPPAAPAPSPAATPAASPPASTPAVAPAPSPDGGSALSGGQEWKVDSIPEKLRVLGEDGKVDVSATLRKVDEHRSNLEKRMGAGDIRPKTADEYKLPETDAFKGLQLDADATAAFRKEAHDMGLSQKQYEGIMTKWAGLAPELVNAGQQDTAAATTAALKEVFGAEYQPKMQAAWRAGEAMAQKIGISPQELDAAIGNNPVAIRMLAALSAEMGEDKTPAAANGGTGGQGASGFDSYMAQDGNMDAYTNPMNLRHAEVSARARQLIEAEGKKR